MSAAKREAHAHISSFFVQVSCTGAGLSAMPLSAAGPFAGSSQLRGVFRFTGGAVDGLALALIVGAAAAADTTAALMDTATGVDTLA